MPANQWEILSETPTAAHAGNVPKGADGQKWEVQSETPTPTFAENLAGGTARTIRLTSEKMNPENALGVMSEADRLASEGKFSRSYLSPFGLMPNENAQTGPTSLSVLSDAINPWSTVQSTYEALRNKDVPDALSNILALALLAKGAPVDTAPIRDAYAGAKPYVGPAAEGFARGAKRGVVDEVTKQGTRSALTATIGSILGQFFGGAVGGGEGGLAGLFGPSAIRGTVEGIQGARDAIRNKRTILNAAEHRAANPPVTPEPQPYTPPAEVVPVPATETPTGRKPGSMATAPQPPPPGVAKPPLWAGITSEPEYTPPEPIISIKADKTPTGRKPGSITTAPLPTPPGKANPLYQGIVGESEYTPPEPIVAITPETTLTGRKAGGIHNQRESTSPETETISSGSHAGVPKGTKAELEPPPGKKGTAKEEGPSDDARFAEFMQRSGTTREGLLAMPAEQVKSLKDKFLKQEKLIRDKENAVAEMDKLKPPPAPPEVPSNEIQKGAPPPADQLPKPDNFVEDANFKTDRENKYRNLLHYFLTEKFSADQLEAMDLKTKNKTQRDAYAHGVKVGNPVKGEYTDMTPKKASQAWNQAVEALRKIEKSNLPKPPKDED